MDPAISHDIDHSAGKGLPAQLHAQTACCGRTKQPHTRKPYRHIFVLMQRIQDAVIDGYTQYQPIICDVLRARLLKRKFAVAYETEISASARWRRRHLELARAKFLILEDVDGTVFAFLMVTADGVGCVRDEPLHDVSRRRIVLGAYELVHDGVGWSWRFTAEAMKEWRSKLRCAIAGNDTAAYWQLVRLLYESAGFRLVRRQVGELANYVRGEWRKVRKGSPPALPSFLPYMRRVSDDWTPNPVAPAIISRGKRAAQTADGLGGSPLTQSISA